ncbi:2-phospho-L-lactate transferase [Dichotomicrobium thermohalophilum]|uniref:LPPG:FO 2-phospho-L-lactate transferase n=1 Tax=Dichotomicrobium thermohalophilum TaxID=933063 RepID=A0A397PNP3_9HYPH|nr:2-phospho-L-lactate transferase [Dichotomicrobium thermohalophilum]RIA47654.1 LPPG:FO 2-phospho-L-lactate transferase [Dichotomicrobium thermohalophilum]
MSGPDHTDTPSGSYVALCGGVGGAKLAYGLAQVLSPGRLTIVVNTGDDFEHLGLHISPDIDTVIYTLSGLANPETGWGRAGETWTFMRVLSDLGEPDWFQLGDGDLAMHVARTHRLRAGESLSEVCAHVCQRLGIDHAVVPMSDDPVRTMVSTDEGRLAFQDYFVRRKSGPAVSEITFEGAHVAQPAPGVLAALAHDDLAGIIVCPSNPYLSVDPLLAIPGLRAALEARRVPLVAVSPIVGGAAIKGPTAKIMRELGVAPSVGSVAEHYGALLDGMVADDADAQALKDAPLAVPTWTTGSVMTSERDRIELARFVIGCCHQLARAANADRHAGGAV